MWPTFILGLVGAAIFYIAYTRPCSICEVIPAGDVCWECGKDRAAAQGAARQEGE